jgi:CelD/BcsL family acetyltransferase involved in cellulose biosynthesis
VLRRAETEAEAETVLDAFFRQKAQRLDALGITNPFALPRTQRFLREAARSGLARGTPALEIWALWAGDRVAAAFGGCSDGHRLSGTFISFEPDPVMMRSSPGELLVRDLVRASCKRGLTIFDLGIGDEGYKRHYCPQVEPRIETVLAVTLAGQIALPVLDGIRGLKNYVKTDPRLLRLARRVTWHLGPRTRP